MQAMFVKNTRRTHVWPNSQQSGFIDDHRSYGYRQTNLTGSLRTRMETAKKS